MDVLAGKDLAVCANVTTVLILCPCCQDMCFRHVRERHL